jgi:hypothetical protein
MSIKFTDVFQYKTLQNLPKLAFLVWKCTIWQHCLHTRILFSVVTSTSCRRCYGSPSSPSALCLAWGFSQLEVLSTCQPAISHPAATRSPSVELSRNNCIENQAPVRFHSTVLHSVKACLHETLFYDTKKLGLSPTVLQSDVRRRTTRKCN